MLLDFSKTYHVAARGFERAFNRDTIEQLLSYQLDKRLDNISPAVDVWRTTVFKVFKTADQEGWLDKLLKAGIAEQPDNTRLAEDIYVVINQRKGLVKARQSGSPFYLLTIGMLVLLIVLGLVWVWILLGMTPSLVLVGISAGIPTLQTFIKSSVIKSVDFKLEIFLRSRWGLITVLAMLVAFSLVSLTVRSVWADAALANNQQIEISRPSKVFLSKGEPAYFWVNPVQRLSMTASLNDHEDVVDEPVYPWSRNQLKLEKFVKPIYVVVIPPTGLMNQLRFEGWSVKITMVENDEIVASESIEKYSGEPILLGRNMALSGAKSLKPIGGAISSESLQRHASVKDDRTQGNPAHKAKVSLGNQEYFFTTTTKPLHPKVNSRLEVEFSFTNQGVPPQTHRAKPFVITPDFAGDLNVLIQKLENMESDP